jgi:hypothetical protein
MPSIPGSSSAIVRTGPEAQQYLEEKAAEWSRRGDVALAKFLESQHALSVSPDRATASRRIGAAPSPSLAIIDRESTDPSPSTRPNAYVYYSSTAPYLSGRSGVIVSTVTYYGNIATTDVTYSASDAKGLVIPRKGVQDRGEGETAS